MTIEEARHAADPAVLGTLEALIDRIDRGATVEELRAAMVQQADSIWERINARSLLGCGVKPREGSA